MSNLNAVVDWIATGAGNNEANPLILFIKGACSPELIHNYCHSYPQCTIHSACDLELRNREEHSFVVGICVDRGWNSWYSIYRSPLFHVHERLVHSS